MKGLVGGIAALYLFLIGFSFFQISSNKGKLANENNILQEFNLVSAEHKKLSKTVSDMKKLLSLAAW